MTKSNQFPTISPPNEAASVGDRVRGQANDHGAPAGWWLLFAILAGLCIWAGIVGAVYALFWSVTEWLPALIELVGWSG